MCSAVCVSGLTPAFAAETIGYFTAPYKLRARFAMPKMDRAKRAVHVTLPNSVVRTASQVGSQRCVTLAVGKGELLFKPWVVKSALSDAKTMLWPVGGSIAIERTAGGNRQGQSAAGAKQRLSRQP